MEKIEVEICGNALLMHSPKSMLLQEDKAKSITKKIDLVKEAENGAYRMKSGELYIPAEALFSALVNGAKYKKIGKFSLPPLIASAIRIEPIEIGLGTKEYETDIRTCVIAQGAKRNRILRARPLIKNWKVKFTIIYNDALITNPDVIKDCLIDAGLRVGLLDFRPACKGSFGTFEVKKWKT